MIRKRKKQVSICIETLLGFEFQLCNTEKTDANFHARLTIHILHSEAEEEDEYNDEESFQGDCNEGKEYGNRVDLFEVHFGISSRNSDKYNDLSDSDILPEDFFKTTYLKVSTS